MVFVKIIVLLLAIGLAIVFAKYREYMVRLVGKNQTAEKYLGPGGSYTLWPLIGIFFIILAVIWLFGLPGQ